MNLVRLRTLLEEDWCPIDTFVQRREKHIRRGWNHKRIADIFLAFNLSHHFLERSHFAGLRKESERLPCFHCRFVVVDLNVNSFPHGPCAIAHLLLSQNIRPFAQNCHSVTNIQ